MKIKLIRRELIQQGPYEMAPETDESFESRINEFLEDHNVKTTKMVSENMCYVVYKEFWEDKV